MNVPVGEGQVIRREHLMQVGAWGELEPPVEFPEILSHVWSSFMDLHNARVSGGMAPSSITYESIESWMKVTGNNLLPWEVAAVKRLDLKWLKVSEESRPKPDSGKSKGKKGRK